MTAHRFVDRLAVNLSRLASCNFGKPQPAEKNPA